MKYFFSVILILVIAGMGIQLSAQGGFKKDSVHVDKGIPGTTDFLPQSRSYIPEHDDTGRPLVVITERQNEEGQWQPWRRRQFEYQNNVLVALLIQYWDNDTQSWADARHRSLNYNNQGQLMIRLYRKAPAPGLPLENDRKWTYGYDNQDQLTGVLLERWQGGEWVNASRRIQDYDDQGLLQEQRVQNWIGGEWKDDRRRSFTYHPTHQGLTSVTGQQWSEQEQTWTNVRRRNSDFDNGGLWSAIRIQNWDTLGGDWQNDYRELVLHGSQNQFEGRIRQIWEDAGWQNQFRGNYSFNGQDLLARFEAWNTEQQEWETDRRYQLSYNSDGLLLLSQGWQKWNADAGMYENDSTSVRYTYFWSDLMTETSKLVIPSACSVPNPYIAGTAISCELPASGTPFTLELFDLLGRRVYESSFFHTETVSILRPLPQGTYLVRIRQKEKLFHLQQLVVF